MRDCLRLIVLSLCLAIVAAAHGAPIDAEGDRSLAVTDPLALHALDTPGNRGLGLARLLDPARDGPIANDALFGQPAMAPVRAALESEFARYLARHAREYPHDSIGVGDGHDVRLFDTALLTSPDTRFVLAGIVNRMDRAYVAPATCGEVRLIYRLTRVRGEGMPRLPMTLNIVLRAREANDIALTCAELAKRWLASTQLAETGEALAERLRAAGGALASISAANIDRIETNLQIAHVPASDRNPFRTDYLQKVFRYDATTMRFVEAPLENQIDRDRLLANAAAAQAFKAWLLAPDQLRALDRGTILVPEPYLATFSVASTPVGFDRSGLQPEAGLMQSEANKNGLFTDHDVVGALQAATAHGVVLQNIRSPAGFARRLNDITCGGCHQIRGIGGFHFPGVDWMAARPSNDATVPMSPHFAGDQLRRRDIVMAMRDGSAPDFSRGFSDRPQTRGRADLAGTALLDGWGATCYRRSATASVDMSFAGWGCAEGLSCPQAGRDAASRIGMCFVK